MSSAIEKDQTAVNNEKPKSRPLYWLGAILLFLLFLFALFDLTSIAPMEFQFGRRAILIESGLAPAPAKTFFEISRAKWGLWSYESLTDTTYALHAGRGFFSVTVRTTDPANHDAAPLGKP